jgi:hypothetical protein
MITGTPFRWSDPTSLPWTVYVWLAFILVGWLKPLWRWTQRQRASSWSTSIGANRIHLGQRGQTILHFDGTTGQFVQFGTRLFVFRRGKHLQRALRIVDSREVANVALAEHPDRCRLSEGRYVANVVDGKGTSL